MRSLEKRRALFALIPVWLLGLLVLAGCSNGNAEGEDTVQYNMGEPVTDSTVAVIVSSDYGSDTLAAAEFREQVQMVMSRMPPAQEPDDRSEDVRRRIAEGFVLRHLVTGEMDQRQLEPDTATVEAQVEAQIAAYRQQAGGEEAFQQRLAESDMTLDSLRQVLRPQVREQMRQQMYQEQLVSEVQDPTSEEVASYSEEQREEEVSAQHILFAVDQNATQQERDSVQAFAQTILDSVQAGADFEELARRYSEGPSARRGGQLDYFSRGEMVPPFEEATFALQDSGAVAPQLVETQFGYHIIRLTGRRMSPAMDTTQARQFMMRERQRGAIENALDELRVKATVRINPSVVEADLNEESEIDS